MPASWHGGGGEEAGRGAGNPLRPAPGLSGIPVGQDDQVVPTDYFNGLVLADLWDSLWFLLMAAVDGKVSENFSSLENEWDRQDQWRWFSRDDPPPLQQPELLKWRHWRPGKIREMEPTTQRALAPYAREMGGTAPCPLRPVCGAHRTHAGHPGGGLPQGGKVMAAAVGGRGKVAWRPSWWARKSPGSSRRLWAHRATSRWKTWRIAGTPRRRLGTMVPGTCASFRQFGWHPTWSGGATRVTTRRARRARQRLPWRSCVTGASWKMLTWPRMGPRSRGWSSKVVMATSRSNGA